MSNIKMKIHFCIDEHGNYRAVGSSDLNDISTKNAIALVEGPIRLDGVATKTGSFQVSVDLPDPQESSANVSEE